MAKRLRRTDRETLRSLASMTERPEPPAPSPDYETRGARRPDPRPAPQPPNVYDWLADQQTGQRLEQESKHSFSVQARHQAAVRRVEETIYPALETVLVELAVALTGTRPEDLVAALRKLSSVGELARFEAEKLEGRA